VPWADLEDEHKNLILSGEGKFLGVRGFFAHLERKKYKLHVRVFLSRYRGYSLCPECNGSRLRLEARQVKVNGRNLCELCGLTVEEALRYEPITPFTARLTTEEVTYRDVTFPEGTLVAVCAFTGNRDLAEDEAGAGGADAFDITADRGKARPLTFGAGVHYCLGANLARVELQEGLAFLSHKLSDLELDGEPEFEGVSGIYGLARLPISFAL